MANTLHVGRGFGKSSFKKAIDRSSQGDTIVIDPGVYNEIVYDLYGLTIKGLGKNPSDVVLNINFTIDEDCYLNLENLTINNLPDKEGILVCKNGKLTADNVKICSTDPNKSALMLLENSDCALSYSEVHTNQDLVSFYVQNTDKVNISNSIVDSIGFSSGKANIIFSRFDYLYLEKKSELSIDELELTNRYEVNIEASDSKIQIGKLVLPEGSSNFTLKNSSLIVKENNINDANKLDIDSDESSTVELQSSDDKPKTSSSTVIPNNNVQTQSTAADDSDSKKVKVNFNQNVEEVKPDFNPNSGSAMDELNGLIGLSDVKEQVNSFIKMAVFNNRRIEQGMLPFELSLNSMFLGNPGTGKTTVARLIGKSMYENGVLPTDKYVEVSRQDLIAEYLGQTQAKTQKVVESALGGVLFIDEAYTLNQLQDSMNYGQEAIDVLLKYMEDHRGELMIIFAGYTKEMQDFLEMNSGLKSRIPNVFTFDDYSPDELEEIGVKSLHSSGLTFDEDYYKRALRKAYSVNYDDSNARWVRNFNEKLIRVFAESGGSLTEISNSDIDKMTLKTKDKNVDELLKELDSMIGLASVKKFVHETVKQATVDQRLADTLPEEERPSYHMVFEGEPGTGKTTVARIIAKMFYSLGILPRDAVAEVSRSDLIAEYLGQTEIKTKKVIKDALGGVLFVDEAYQLNGSSDEDYGKAVIETFITELENNRQKFISIFAGYTKQMEEFLNTNPGLRSRIPLKIEFDSYSPDEIAEIVILQITKNWQVNVDLLKSIVSDKYAALPDEDKSNGRWARNYSEQLVRNHKLWLADHPDVTDITRISDDVLKASKDY
ncbi:AAA family ATPase [Xylocopilactobacillus apis]|uniref:ATPase n=1 Tax=Xylocopilactobacillus apis TaxID=2932183 RepID=A0AAU9DEJ9_9LACO|nr:AAA family ATPase [Xylocopilactobacillus apis]BDR56596.1 ATPase [Xylocopilactobacillus apis]